MVRHTRPAKRNAVNDALMAPLQGAVVGGSLELATACHIRVADESTFHALPDGSRGIFVGGGGSVRARCVFPNSSAWHA